MNGDNLKQQSDGATDHTLIGEQSSKTDHDATGFLTDGKDVSSDYNRAPEDEGLMSSLHPLAEDRHSIEKILSRPVKIRTTVFSASNAAGTPLGDPIDVLNTLRTFTGFRLAREKLSGFYGVHMNAHLKITLNAQPFETGFFQIFFEPFFATYGTKVNISNISTERTLPYTTGCPNVYCNVSLQSSVELKVPYTGPTAFINMTNPASDFGRFFIQSIVPLADSTNAASCELSVYMFFTDVKLFGASPRTWTLQADVPNPPMGEADCKTNPFKQGPLSKIASNAMPILDSLGLSAPTANLNPNRFRQDPYASPATADTTKTPLKTAYLSTQQVDQGQLGIDSNDEMDIAYFCMKPTYLNQFSWDIRTDAGTLLYQYKVEPNCILNYALDNLRIIPPTRLRFMANAFRYWRGTMRFTFHVIANKFHSGRLRFVMSLGGVIPSDRISELYPYAFNQIVDLRDATSFVIDCPYFSSAPFRLVPQEFENGTFNSPTTSLTNLVDVVPYLQVFVENELRAPDTTSTSIQIVCLQSGTEDLEFSSPIAPTALPVFDYSAAAQVNATLQADMIKPISMVPGSIGKDPSSSPHSCTTGEKITSIRQLLKRYQLIGSGSIPIGDNRYSDFVLYPFAFLKPINENFLSAEMVSYFRTCFVFFRGGMRYLITTRDQNAQFTLRYDPNIYTTRYFSTSAGQIGNKTPLRQITSYEQGGSLVTLPLTASIPFFSPLQGGMEFEIPYYSRYHKLGASFTSDLTRYEQDVRAGLEPAGYCLVQTYGNQADYTNYAHVYRTVADDFNLGYLLGAPFCAVNVTPRG